MAKLFLARKAAVFSVVPGLEISESLFGPIDNVIFCIKDPDRRYVAINDAFLRRTRLRDPSALLGRTAREVFPALLASGYERQDDDVFLRGETVRDRLEMVTQPDGGIGWFISQKMPVRSASGKVVALAGTSRDLCISAEPGDQLDLLGAALKTLHRDCGSPLRIETLARESGLSGSQFHRKVQRMTGLPPRKLLTKARVEAAALALRDSDRSLAVIAAECGFYDQAAFSRQFREATGMSPKHYRKGLRELSHFRG